MSHTLNKTELEHATNLHAAAEQIKAALSNFYSLSANYAKVTRNHALGHQVINQAFSVAGVRKLLENIDAVQDGLLEKVARDQGQVTTPPQIIGAFLVPSYTYTPVDKVKPSLMSKDDGDFLKVLEAMIKTGEVAVEKRLVAAKFTDPVKGPKLLEACAGLVNVTREPGWSIKKA